MKQAPAQASTSSTEYNVTSILEWLARAHGRSAAEESEQLYRQLLLLRDTPIPSSQRLKLLDLLYGQVERIMIAELPHLNEISLPISRKIRQRVRSMLDMLSTLTQDYFNTLADLFDPDSDSALRMPQTTLRRIMHCLSWQIQVNHLIASPTGIGVWQQLHAALRTARRLGLDKLPAPRNGQTIHQIYACILLSAIAHPASFRAEELAFITEYIARSKALPDFFESPPLGSKSIFWIDPDKDFPAHALVRRTPASEFQMLYFSCDDMAAAAAYHLSELGKGTSPAQLDLPDFAGKRAGQAVIKRLQSLWGMPRKRRFPRRRQSYRVLLWTGLDNLWQLARDPASLPTGSEWMVTNESPDGYALMHMNGETQHLRVGDIVALQTIGERAEFTPVWHVCIVRWALSENPEHIELGLQLLSSQIQAAEIAQPGEHLSALFLPPAPPLRGSHSLIVPSGRLIDDQGKLIVMIEHKNLAIREMRATRLDEQTASIEMFSVAPDER